MKIFSPRKIIAVLGSQGGGRDRSKRPELGRIAGEYADIIIVTNEDPYDENPGQIIEDVAGGIASPRYSGLDPESRLVNLDSRFRGNDKCREIFKITDRKAAIKRALSLAEPADIIIITGKSGEVWMCIENGRKIPWSDRRIVEEALSAGSMF